MSVDPTKGGGLALAGPPVDTYTASNTFAQMIGNSKAKFDSAHDGGDMITRNTAEDLILQRLDDNINEALVSYYTGPNDADLSAGSAKVLGWTNQILDPSTGVTRGNEYESKDAMKVLDWLAHIYAPEPEPAAAQTNLAGPAGTSGGTGTSAPVDIDKMVKNVLGASSSGEKLDLFGAMLDAIIEDLMREQAGRESNAGAGTGLGGTPTSGATGGDTPTGSTPASTEVSGGTGGTPPAPPQLTERAYSADEIAQNSEIGQGFSLRQNGDGSIGIKSKKGKENDELDAGEGPWVIHASPGNQGGSVDLGKFHATGKRGQELGVMRIHRPDGTVDEVALRGNFSGNQTVNIDGAFTKIELEARGDNSDFSLRGFKVKEPAEGGATGTGGAGDTPNAVGNSGGLSDIMNSVTNAGVKDFLSALQEAAKIIQASTAIPEKEKNEIIDLLSQLGGAVAKAAGAGGASTPELTGEEKLGVLQSLRDIVTKLDGLTLSETQKSAVVDML
ncbi:MAG: hypothetical protein AAFQ33_14615, partial [Pseudomonadota bacterium]